MSGIDDLLPKSDDRWITATRRAQGIADRGLGCAPVDRKLTGLLNSVRSAADRPMLPERKATFSPYVLAPGEPLIDVPTQAIVGGR